MHCLEINCIYILSIDRQTVNYYTTIHALELIYFDSNIQYIKQCLCDPVYKCIVGLQIFSFRLNAT